MQRDTTIGDCTFTPDVSAEVHFGTRTIDSHTIA